MKFVLDPFEWLFFPHDLGRILENTDGLNFLKFMYGHLLR